ncbi:hypothetical protein DFJ58DRAFT_66418 [Suillus subalutaceus]|uniref:uncharacterized protein n=1 Tax=Suillus subalutaceus TaxID=48586 RepID=UPI001B87D2B9|nr:uncharacterized protein DFJ58DRAFT_66418 [Suillus subalutaceus]KAG1842013.1 hypothetical protein DFJ58DRAFT_66418 [Suillus subalutaceus]
MPQPNSKRAPTPVRTAAPFAPHDAMVASQQGHIENLVQKTRNLEHTIKKLNDELSLEQTRAKDTVNVTKQQWRAEQKEWHVGCDALQACHRIAHLRTACALDDERIAVLKEREIARRERLARIQRDYKITMFQAREAELEGQIEDLQADLDSQVAQTQYSLKSRDQQYQKTILDLRTRDATLSSELKLKSDEIVAAHKQREDVEDELRRLREAQADADAATVTNVSKLSRITVQRDGLQARVTQLERELEDHKDNSAKLQRQLDNWQGLKKGDDVDLEILRKKNVELEVQLREVNAVIQERDKALEKEKGRTTKLKEVLHEWKTEAGEQTTLQKQAADEAADAKKAAEKLEQEISDLKAQLTAALKTSAAPKSQSNTTSLPIPLPSEEADQTLPKPKPKPKKRLTLDDSDIELIEPSAKAKGKRKASQEDSTDEKPAAEKPKRARAKKPASAPNEKAPKKRTLESEAKKQKKAAESSQAKTSKSAAIADSAAEDDQELAPKKKKRKLNVGIFPSMQPQPPVFQWDQGGTGLGIPTELSPVKDAPRRLHPSSTGPSFAKTRG